MLLKKLINKLSKDKKKIEVKGLASNSKNVKEGFIFFAIKGYKTNGEKYISEAIRRGAIAVICSKNCKYVNPSFSKLAFYGIGAFLLAHSLHLSHYI